VPFLTHGATCVWAAPAGRNGKSCDGEYYGVGWMRTDFDNSPYAFSAPLDVTRVDGNGATIGKWDVKDGATSSMLGNMRHFAAHTGGRYILRFPGKPLPRWYFAEITNAYRTTDSFVFAVSFDGSVNAQATLTSGSSSTGRVMTPVSSLAEVEASAGDRFWQDRANNLVWVRVAGGLPYPNVGNLDVDEDEALYRTMFLNIQSQ
jgi:hypothetical protein